MATIPPSAANWLARTQLFRSFWAGLTLCGAGALAIGATGSLPVEQRGQREERTPNQQRVYVSVVDKKGAPAPTLAVTDLTIKEDGVSREVLKVEPATGAMQIAILADTSATTAAAVSDLRLALKAFGAAIREKSPECG